MSLDVASLEGEVDASGLRIGIIVSRFNSSITDALLAGALDALKRHGATDEHILTVRVPGALEIGTIAAGLSNSGRVDALVCLGCVIRGETTHYQHVCESVTDALTQVSLRGTIGLGNGVITVENDEQALARIGGSHGHKGAEAALVAVEMANIIKRLEL